MDRFRLKAPFEPSGDQPQAIEKLTRGVLGGMKEARYREYELLISPGDQLFVYTDGVPEATAAGGEMFGTDRMITALNTCPGGGPEVVLKEVRSAVDAFVGDEEPFDDLTMMCVEYRGPRESARTQGRPEH